MTDAYPLQWPHGQPRTKIRTDSVFRVTPAVSYAEMIKELESFGAKNVVVSTNIPLRKDGTPYRDGLTEKMYDPGVAVYFLRGKTQVAIAVDQYLLPWENCRALGKAIEAFRAIERSGAKQVLDQAFTGFAALPPPTQGRHWSEIIGVPRTASVADIQAAYKAKARVVIGDDLQMLNIARDAAILEVSL